MDMITKIFVIFTNERIPFNQTTNKKIYFFYCKEFVKVGDLLITSNYNTAIQVIGIGECIPEKGKEYVKLDILQIRRLVEKQKSQKLGRSRIVERHTLIGNLDYSDYRNDDYNSYKPSNNGFELFGHHEIWSD